MLVLFGLLVVSRIERLSYLPTSQTMVSERLGGDRDADHAAGGLGMGS
jgi:hypothetical protein